MLPIYSTGRGRESVAIELAKKVDNCHHVPAVDAVALVSAEHYVELAENLIGAAEALTDKAEYDDRAGELLVRAEELLEEAEDHLDEFDMIVDDVRSYEEKARVAGMEARVFLQSANRKSPTTSVTELLVEADEAATRAESELRALVRPSLGCEVRERITQVRRRIAAVRQRVEP